jgi:SAM-dependent methyltransferase
LTPARVVAEIHRVLRPDGLVYADTPFLQHVHEGPFDFTRFTESGHRWLFRNFSLVESGVVAGVGTQLAWSVAHAIRSVVPRRGVASLVRFFMTPLAIALDRFARPRYAVDGASSVYFYGRRAPESIRPRDMIAHYRGAQPTPSR